MSGMKPGHIGDGIGLKTAPGFSYFSMKGMQMMRRFLAILSFSFAFAAAQETGPGRPGAAGMPPAGQAMRGIEKKDIRAIIVYPEGVYQPGDVQRFEAAVAGLVEAIASGAKLTKADAARAANPAGANEELAQSIQRRFTQERRVVVVGMTAAPASAGNRPVACPPPDCGCQQNGGISKSCDCGLLKRGDSGFCFCEFCYDPVKLSEYPIDLRLKGPTQAPGKAQPDGVLIVTVLPPDASPEMPARLVKTAMETFNSEPWPARITIKTKSSNVR